MVIFHSDVSLPEGTFSMSDARLTIKMARKINPLTSQIKQLCFKLNPSTDRMVRSLYHYMSIHMNIYKCMLDLI